MGGETAKPHIASRYLDYSAGYTKALMDLRAWLVRAEPAFRGDRKRNNVQNVVWLLDGILEDVGTFEAYGDATPISFYAADKKQGYRYYIDHNDWPLNCEGK